MTSPKHSPAPWNINVGHSPAPIIDANRECIAKVYLTDIKTRKRDQTHVANANLIVAAPELLAALHEIAKVAKVGRDDYGPAAASRMVEIAAHAIAKAEK